MTFFISARLLSPSLLFITLETTDSTPCHHTWHGLSLTPAGWSVCLPGHTHGLWQRWCRNHLWIFFHSTKYYFPSLFSPTSFSLFSPLKSWIQSNVLKFCNIRYILFWIPWLAFWWSIKSEVTQYLTLQCWTSLSLPSLTLELIFIALKLSLRYLLYTKNMQTFRNVRCP